MRKKQNGKRKQLKIMMVQRIKLSIGTIDKVVVIENNYCWRIFLVPQRIVGNKISRTISLNFPKRRERILPNTLMLSVLISIRIGEC